MSVRPYKAARLQMERFALNFRFVDFFIRKSAQKIYFHLKSHKNDRCFTRRPMYIDDSNSLSYRQNEKYFRQKLYRKSNHIHGILLSVTLSFRIFVPFMKCGNLWHSRTGRRYKYNTAHARCVLDN
jgi:hypothetical protein